MSKIFMKSKSFFYKKFKLFLKFFLAIVPIGIIVSCAKFGNFSNFIGIGSNSVSPLVMGQNSLMTENPIGDYTYQNTGSGDGYKSQMNLNGFQADFGMSSSRKNPKTYGKDDDQLVLQLEKLWSDKKLRTITYAFDAIGIGVNLPLEMKLKSLVPIINLGELAKLYSKDKTLASSVSWASLIMNEINSSKWSSTSSTNRPIAIGIKGGKNTSGKAEAFVKMIDKKLTPSAKNPKQEEVVSNQKFSFVDSFNDIYWENQKLEGSIAYYSLGQINDINLTKIKIAAINELMSDPSKSPNIKMVQTKQYHWSRPFNIIYSIDNDKSVAFANYLLSHKAQKLILKKNFVPLNLNQINIQLPTWLPDLDYKDKNNELIIKGVQNKTTSELILDYGL